MLEVEKVSVNVMDLGKRPYQEVWNLQKDLQQKRINKEIDDVLILVEHDPVNDKPGILALGGKVAELESPLVRLRCSMNCIRMK